MDNFLISLAQAIIALFIVVDPFGNIPIFVGLTENMPKEKERKVYNTAVLVGFVLLLIFAFTGQEIFSLFGISLSSFEIAGGILLLIIAIRILVTGTKQENIEYPESLGAVPIAMPLLVGPGAITTTILNLQTFGVIVAVLAVIAVLTLAWIILRFIDKVYKVLGRTGAVIIARVMALLIAAIAVQYIVDGVTVLFS
ncbi:MAG: MarC family protein [Candidatus Bathyarchaeia archaeon]